MKKLIIISGLLVIPILAWAQVPKMHIKMFGGWNATRLALRIEGTTKYLHGWQAGGGFRVIHRKAFVESDITFLKYGLTYQPFDEVDGMIPEPVDIKIRSLEVPLTMGYVPVNKPLLKCFLYGGLVNRFMLNGRYGPEGEEETFPPGDLNLHIYSLAARAGIQVDIGLLNIDFSYTIGITNSFKGALRTNSHGIILSAGLAL
jgi:hypothetical protein